MKTCTRQIFEATSITTILAVIVLEFTSSLYCTENVAVFQSYGDYYLVYYYPLFVAASFVVFGINMAVKAFMYKSCIYNKVISSTFLLAHLVTLLKIYFGFNWGVFYNIWALIIDLGIVICCLLFYKNLIIRNKNKKNNLKQTKQ